MSKPSVQAHSGSHRPPAPSAPKVSNDPGESDATLLQELAELRQRNRVMERKLRGIEAISKSLVSEHNLERILEAILGRTTELLQADRATLYLLDNDNQSMWSTVALGEELETIQLEVGQGIAGWVAKHGRPVNVKDAYRDPRFDQAVDKKTSYRTKSVLAWPLTNSRQQTIGVIQVLNKAEGYFTVADEDLLEAIASQAAITIQNSKLYLDIVGKNIDLLETQMRLRSRKRELELLFAVERAAAKTRELDAALGAIVQTVCAELPAESAGVVLYDRFRDCLVIQAAAGTTSDNLCQSQLSAVDGVMAEVFTSGEARFMVGSVANEALSAWREQSPGLKIRSAAVIPIEQRNKDRGDRLGVLVLINRSGEGRTFDADARVLDSIASRVGLSWELIRSRQEEEKAERLAAIGRTLSSVVHDLKTPLTIINGYAQLMARESDGDKRAGYKELVQKQIAQIKGMTQEVLSFARGESKVLLRKVFVDQFLSEVRDQLAPEFIEAGVALEFQPTYRGAVRIDNDKMKRVVFNLARNAREALGDRGGHFAIGVEEVDDTVVFRFSDDGPGIPEAMRGRLFESFATHGKKHGTGLGLAIVKKIVEEHSGTIAVESAPDQGTTFSIVLPMSAGA